MPASDYPSVLAALSDRRKEQFVAAVILLEEGRNEGQIPNARYLDVKHTIGRAMDQAWEESVKKPLFWSGNYTEQEAEKEPLNAVRYAGTPAPHLMKAHNRMAAAIGDTVAGRAIRAFLLEVSPLMELLAHGKTIAVKRPTGEAAAAIRAEASPLRAVSRPTLKLVNDILDEITSASRVQLTEMIRLRGEALLKKFREWANETVEKAKSEGRKAPNTSPYNFSVKIGNGQSAPAVRMLLDKLVEPGWSGYQPHKDYEQRLLQHSRERADEICAEFTQRNLLKLSPVIEQKGNLDKVSVVGNHINPAGMEAHLRAEFLDGSRFDMRTSVVWSTSTLGNAFTRFPVTFHDVIMPDGSAMTGPSEERINEIFARFTPPDPVEPETDEEPAPAPGN